MKLAPPYGFRKVMPAAKARGTGEMADDTQDEAEQAVPRRKVNLMVAGGIAGLLIVIAAAVFFSFRFVAGERARVLQEWQIRL